MPVCLACNGRGELWVDWAEDYTTCMRCDKGQVSEKEARLQERQRANRRRKQMARNPGRAAKRYKGYRIQQVSLTWTDYDTIGAVKWDTMRVVETLAFGVFLVRKLNEQDAPYCDCGSPWRLVSPNNKVVNCIGAEGQTAYGAHHYPVPNEY